MSDKLREALEKLLQTGYCNDTCSHQLSEPYACDCWKAELRAALKEEVEWRTVIVGLPIIRKLLNGEDVEIKTFRINLIPDDVLHNARPKQPPAEAKGQELDGTWTSDGDFYPADGSKPYLHDPEPPAEAPANAPLLIESTLVGKASSDSERVLKLAARLRPEQFLTIRRDVLDEIQADAVAAEREKWERVIDQQNKERIAIIEENKRNYDELLGRLAAERERCAKDVNDLREVESVLLASISRIRWARGTNKLDEAIRQAIKIQATIDSKKAIRATPASEPEPPAKPKEQR